MKSIFLSPEQLFEKPLSLFSAAGTAAAPNDFCLLTAPDDGFVFEPGGINYFLSGDACADRFGRRNECAICAVRPALLLEEGDERLLRRITKEEGAVVAEYGEWPSAVLDSSLRELALRSFQSGTLHRTKLALKLGEMELPVWQLGAKRMIALTLTQGNLNGYVQLSDGTAVTEGETVFLEFRPVRWLADKANRLLVSEQALFAGLDREQAAEYLGGAFLRDLTAEEESEESGDREFRILQHDELSLIRSFVDADIPVFLHGLSGDGKSDRVRQIDPDVLDIELVNENPETINGRAIYNEAKDEIIDIKPVWLVKLERLCEDGKNHILFFDELTNATKQTQSVIFKIVLERFVNNRWPLPENARIVAAGNDRSESSAAHDLAEPLFGRFAHIYIRTTVENWMPWAVGKRINPFVMEFLANNSLYLRTPYTGEEGYADPRRWEMASKALDASGNDFSLLVPIVGRDTAEAFIRFFRAQEQLAALGEYADEELSRYSAARRYQLAQQCVWLYPVKPAEAKALAARLGEEYLAWFEYVLSRKSEKR